LICVLELIESTSDETYDEFEISGDMIDVEYEEASLTQRKQRKQATQASKQDWHRCCGCDYVYFLLIYLMNKYFTELTVMMPVQGYAAATIVP
jgi:hypothetical protein